MEFELEANAEWGIVKKYLYSLLPDLLAFLWTVILAVIVYFMQTYSMIIWLGFTIIPK